MFCCANGSLILSAGMNGCVICLLCCANRLLRYVGLRTELAVLWNSGEWYSLVVGTPQYFSTRDWLKNLFAVQDDLFGSHDSMEAKRCVMSVAPWLRAHSLMSSGSVSRMKHMGGCPPRLLDEWGRLTVLATEKILRRLNRCQYLEDNEIELLIALLKFTLTPVFSLSQSKYTLRS